MKPRYKHWSSIPSGIFIATLLVGLLTVDAYGFGFGWVSKAVNIVKKGLGVVGQVVGAPFGGFIDSVTAPTILNADRVKEIVSQANVAAEQRIAQLDEAFKNRLAQMDGILGKRIEQADMVMSNRIVQVDGVLASRIEQLDTTLAQRLNQLDELAETRIGNIDVVATKAALTLEESLIRFLLVGCLMVFLSVAMWLIYQKSISLWPAVSAGPGSFSQKLRALIRQLWPQISGRVALTGAALLILYFAFSFLPGGPRSRKQLIAKNHEEAMNRQLAMFNFKDAAYHASQIKALDSTDARLSAARIKVELIRDVFRAPNGVQSADSLARIAERIVEVEQAIGSATDPDLETLKGFILWRTAKDKVLEHYAASCFAIALRDAPERGFPLQGLALSCLDVYLDSPISLLAFNDFNSQSDEYARSLRDSVKMLFGKSATILSVADLRSSYLQALNIMGATNYSVALYSGPNDLQPYVQYNHQVKRLRRDFLPKYVEMLDHFVAGQSRRGAMSDAAKSVSEAWVRFNKSVLEIDATMSPTIPLARLLLNDAFEGRARLFYDPAILDLPKQNDGGIPQITRVACLADMQRILPEGNQALRRLVNYQEARRYWAFETDVMEFERAYVEFRSKGGSAPQDAEKAKVALRAAAAAGRLGICRYTPEGSEPLADAILGEAGLKSGAPLKGELAESYHAAMLAICIRPPGAL